MPVADSSPRIGPVARPGADVALDQQRVASRSPPRSRPRPRRGRRRPRRACRRRRGRRAGRRSTSSRVPSRWVRASTTFFSVCAAVHSPSAGARAGAAFAWSTSVGDRRRVRRVEDDRRRAGRRTGSRSGTDGRERLDVRGVAAGRAHEGVLADRGRVQELLGARSAHGARRRPATMTYSRPRRWKMRSYASRCAWYEASSPASV